MNRVALGLLFLLLFVTSTIVSAQLGLSPNYFDLSEAQARRTQSFRLTNFGAEPVRIRTELVPFDIDEQGKVIELPPHARSLERHLAIAPIEFEIPASGSQVVRFALRPVKALEPGEYRGMVYFRLAGTASMDGRKFPVSYRLGGAVYVQVGDAQRSAVLEAIEPHNGREVNFRLRSTGSANARMSGRYTVWTAAAWGQGRELPPLPQQRKPMPAGLVMNGAIPGRPVLPGKTVSYSAPLSQDDKRLATGDYVLHVDGELEGESIRRVIPFRVNAAAQ